MKKIKDLTLEECRKICKETDLCQNCPLNDLCDYDFCNWEDKYLNKNIEMIDVPVDDEPTQNCVEETAQDGAEPNLEQRCQDLQYDAEEYHRLWKTEQQKNQDLQQKVYYLELEKKILLKEISRLHSDCGD